MPDMGTQTEPGKLTVSLPCQDAATSTHLSEQPEEPTLDLSPTGSEPGFRPRSASQPELRRGKRKRKKKYKSIRFYQVKRLRRSRKRREKQGTGKARKHVDPTISGEDDYLMPPLEIAGDPCPPMISLREPARRAVAPNRNVKPGIRFPAHPVPMPMLTDAPSESVEVKIERPSAVSMVKQEIISAQQATLASLGGRAIKQEHNMQVDTGNVLASLMPVRSERGMVRYFPDRPDPKRLSNRGKVIAPMGTMPNHIMMYRQLSHGQSPLSSGDNLVKAEAVCPIKKET